MMILPDQVVSSKSFFIRNAKVWGIPATDKIVELHEKYANISNKVSLYIWQELRDGNFIKVSTHKILLSNGSQLKDTELKDILNHFFEDKIEKIESIKRSLVKYVMERYSSYMNKHKKAPNSPIRFHKNKTIYFKDCHIKLDKENKKFIASTIIGTVELPYLYSLKLDLIRKKKFGGNLIRSKDGKSYSFVCAIIKEFFPLYKPTSYLGYDLNMNSDNWIVFSDRTIIKRPEDLNDIIDQIKSNNKILNEKNFPIKKRTQRSKSRRKTRIKVKELHAKLKNKAQTIIDFIINKVISKKAILCIDSVKCGKKTGTFGQEYIKHGLINACQNKGVPYYVIPTPYTTLTCNKCGFCSKKNKIDSNNFKCVSCGHKNLTHFNAALNIMNAGKKLKKEKKPFGNYENNEKKKYTIEEFMK